MAAMKLEEYLNELRARLRGMPDEERSEIIAELRSHVLDSAGEGADENAVAAALARLGPPGELAAQYRTQSLLAKAGSSSSPWTLIRGLLLLATQNVVGFLALIGLLFGYLVTLSFFCAALVKPFAPDKTGLWWLHGEEISLRIGLSMGEPPRGVEILGWWIIPIGLFLGGLAFWLTRRFGRWAIRRSKKTPGHQVTKFSQ